MTTSTATPRGIPARAEVDYAPYVAGIRAREVAAAVRREALRARAMTQAARAAEVLRSRHGATRVLAFGSLLRPGAFDDRSDIDLAVAGIPPQRFLRAWADAATVLDRELDLVDLDDCPARLRAAIEQGGQNL